jgi:hypothetical protein
MDQLPVRDLPAHPAPARGSQQVLETIEHIVCTRTEVITPAGRAPANIVTWHVRERTDAMASGRPLARFAAGRRRVGGQILITAQTDLWHYTAVVPVQSAAQVLDLRARIGRARTLRRELLRRERLDQPAPA